MDDNFALGPKGDEEYILNPRLQEFYKGRGPFDPEWYSSIYDARGACSGDVFLVFPGISLDKIDLSCLKGRPTMPVNVAGFVVGGLWCVLECRAATRMIDMIKERHVVGRDFVMSPRAAVWCRDKDPNHRFVRRTFLAPYWERGVIPDRTYAAGTVGAIISAYLLGYSRAFLVGLDLTTSGGSHRYASKCPEIPEWGGREVSSRIRDSNPYTCQVNELNAVETPGMEIYNTSNLSRGLLKFPFVHLYSALRGMRESEGL